MAIRKRRDRSRRRRAAAAAVETTVPAQNLAAFGLEDDGPPGGDPLGLAIDPTDTAGVVDDTPPPTAPRKKRPQTTYSTDISVEGIKQSSQGGGDRFLYFKNDGDRAEVRFLNDLRKGKKVKRHEQWPGLRPVTCLVTYGEDCPYCAQDIPTKDWYAWNVIDFKNGKVKVGAFKAVAGGVPQQLASFWTERGTICDVNYVIKQLNSGKDRKFQVLEQRRDGAEDKAKIKRALQVLLPKQYDLLEALRPPKELPKVGEGDGEAQPSGQDFEINVD